MSRSKWVGPKEQLDAARNPSSETSDLRQLAKSSYGFVRLAVAENQASIADLLTEMVPKAIDSPEDQRVALAIAKRLDCPVEALDALASILANGLSEAFGPDPVLLAAQAIAENPSSTAGTLGLLTKSGLHSEAKVRNVRSGVQEHLAERRRGSLIRRKLLSVLTSRRIPYETAEHGDQDLIARIPTHSGNVDHYSVFEEQNGFIIFWDEQLHTHVDCYEDLPAEQWAATLAELACSHLEARLFE